MVRLLSLALHGFGPAMRDLFEEIKRRNVFRVAFVYAIASWLTMQIVDVMFPALKLPEWMTSAIAAMLLIGFPFALIFAWAFEMTPEGIKLEKDVDRSKSITPHTGRKLNQSALIILAVAVAFLLFDKFVLRPDVAQQVADTADEVVATIKPSIAVLPFVNMSGDVENEYFSDGLSEELLNVLAKIPQLHVVGRTSSFAFKGQNQDLRSIGEQLDVAHILEGSVRKSNTRLRITAQLVDTQNGYHLWSETYDREVTDIFAVQDEISAAVVAALRVTLLGSIVTSNRGTQNLDAYELYLKSRYFLEHTSEENLLKAIAAADKAIELDPGYAGAYTLRAVAEGDMISGFASEGSEFIAGFERVRAYAQKAAELDPDSAVAHFVQGFVAATADWDFSTAQRHFSRALELDPNQIGALEWQSAILGAFGKFDESLALLEAALKVEPLSITIKRNIGDAYLWMRNYGEAIKAYESILSLNDSVTRVYGRLSRAMLLMGELDAAAELAAKEETQWVREFLDILILARRGKTAEWRDAIDAYNAEYGDLNAYQMAEIYGDAGDIDEAFRWLEVAREVHDPGTITARVDHFLDALHDDPRWPKFIDSIGLGD